MRTKRAGRSKAFRVGNLQETSSWPLFFTAGQGTRQHPFGLVQASGGVLRKLSSASAISRDRELSRIGLTSRNLLGCRTSTARATTLPHRKTPYELRSLRSLLRTWNRHGFFALLEALSTCIGGPDFSPEDSHRCQQLPREPPKPNHRTSPQQCDRLHQLLFDLLGQLLDRVPFFSFCGLSGEHGPDAISARCFASSASYVVR